jgi:hypothetical protein
MTEAITDNLVRHQQEVERIRNNPDLSEPAKRRMINEATARAAEENKRLQQEQREALAEAVASAERKVLSISYPERASAHEKALIAMSYRDARRQAESAESLSDLLDQAEKSGDAQLAEAVYHAATLKGNRAVADRYLESRPTARRRWENYVEARREAESVGNLLHRGLEQALATRELGG